MKRLIAGIALAGLTAIPAYAALKTGEKAPDFKTSAALAGKVTPFDMAAARKTGPVVLYFYPKANTAGCDLEARTFAESIDEFKAQGATVVGVSRDSIDTLKVYSANTATCNGKFPVASDASGTITKSYDVVLKFGANEVSDRTSFVIAPDGKVLYQFTDRGNAPAHVHNTLDAVKAWKASQKK